MDASLTLSTRMFDAHNLLPALLAQASVSYSSRLWAIVLGIVFAVIALSLAVASWTRWGQNKPLTKCVALAVLAHVWLLLYAYGTRIIHPGNGSGPGAPSLSSQGPMSFEVLAAPTLEPQSNEQAQDDKAIEVPPWAKPVEASVPLEIPETLPVTPAKEVDTQLAEVQLEVPPELLEPMAEPSLPQRTSDTANIVQEPLLPELLAPSPNDAHLETIDTAGIDKPSEATDIHAENSNAISDSSTTLVSLPRSDHGNGAARVSTKHFKKSSAPAPSTNIYQLRSSPTRSQITFQNGGDNKSETAVAAALAYLARNQQRDGSWSSALSGGGRETRTLNENRYGTGGKADTAVTGLALLAFLGDGHTHLKGEYRANVTAALEFLIASQLPSGDLSGPKQVGNQPDVRYAKMYSHGIALLAMAEAYAMTNDSRLQNAVLRACNYTLQAQNPQTGGWRYDAKYTGDPGDLSQFGWQALAIQSCRRGGVQINEDTLDKMQSFLNSVNVGPHLGLAVYRPYPNQQPTAAMTAEAFAARAMLGRGWSDEAQLEATQMLLANLPGKTEDNFYYFYYATLALFQQQGDSWLTWNAALKPHLVTTQVASGANEGSWDPTCIWSGYGGRVYSTAMACMCLQVYYRYLPMYDNQ